MTTAGSNSSEVLPCPVVPGVRGRGRPEVPTPLPTPHPLGRPSRPFSPPGPAAQRPAPSSALPPGPSFPNTSRPQWPRACDEVQAGVGTPGRMHLCIWSSWNPCTGGAQSGWSWVRIRTRAGSSTQDPALRRLERPQVPQPGPLPFLPTSGCSSASPFLLRCRKGGAPATSPVSPPPLSPHVTSVLGTAPTGGSEGALVGARERSWGGCVGAIRALLVPASVAPSWRCCEAGGGRSMGPRPVPVPPTGLGAVCPDTRVTLEATCVLQYHLCFSVISHEA